MDVDTRCTKCRLCTPVGYVKDQAGSCSRITFEEKFKQLFVCGNGESEYYGLVFLHYRRACGDLKPK